MKAKRSVILGALGLLAVATAIFVVCTSRPPVAPTSTWAALQGLSRPRIATAVQAFSRDRKSGAGDLTNTVSLKELLSGGYVQPADVRGLEGKNVTVSLAVGKATPSMVWISVRETDGSQIGLLGDGSIAVLPKP